MADLPDIKLIRTDTTLDLKFVHTRGASRGDECLALFFYMKSGYIHVWIYNCLYRLHHGTQ